MGFGVFTGSNRWRRFNMELNCTKFIGIIRKYKTRRVVIVEQIGRGTKKLVPSPVQ